MSFGTPSLIPSPQAGRRLSTQALNNPSLTGATAQTSGFAQAGDNPNAPPTVPNSGLGTSPTTRSGFASMNPFAGAGAVPGAAASGFTGGLGGLQSSPNVPAPGASINPATGQPHTAGLTRAELEAIRAKGADLLDPAPQSVQARRGSSVTAADQKHLEDLSGREQAARQLAGNVPASPTSPTAATASRPSVDRTATRQMPGAFGSVPQVPVPGATGSNTTSVYEDVNEVLAKVGSTAFSVLPASLKNALSNSSETPRSTLSPNSVAATSPTARRSSVAAIFENVKQQTSSLVAEARTLAAESTQSAPRRDSAGRESVGSTPASPITGAGRRLSTAFSGVTAEGGTLDKVKGFLAEAWVPPHMAQTQPLPGAGVAILPTDSAADGRAQNQGVRPGEVSAGSALSASGPADAHSSASGSATTPSAPPPAPAVLAAAPAEAADHTVTKAEGDIAPASFRSGSATTPSALPTASAVLAAAPAESTDHTVTKAEGDIAPASSSEIPDVGSTGATAAVPTKAFDVNSPNSAQTGQSLGHSGHGASRVPGHDPETAGSSVLEGLTDNIPHSTLSTGSSGGYTGLAAPLPYTQLGKGADEGATKVTAIPGIIAEKTEKLTNNESSSFDDSVKNRSINDDESPSSSLLTPSQPINDRTTSMASITAIRHGHVGDRQHEHGSSPLATIADSGLATSLASGEGLTHGQSSTTRGTGPTTTESLTPGKETDGVGHPSTRGVEETSREPGSYPTADHGVSGTSTSHTATPLTGTTGTSTNSASSTPASGHAHGLDAIPNESVSRPTTAPSSQGKTMSLSDPSHALPNSTTPSSTSTPTSASSTTAAGKTAHSALGHGPPTSAAHDLHNRTSSSSSSNGKKKAGFMSKLKGEMKVISGKLGGDEAKVQEGEKLKHGL